ncbi:MAG TPA: hypothetical protein VJS69_15245 [Candidatus Krumholzibacteria bacterium]|nr:hypothetical protein [Candidatus Krumholzibacteria bacterium]
MKTLSGNFLLTLICVVVLLVAAEFVLRIGYTPPARTLAPNVKSRTTTSEYDVTIETNAQGFRDSGAHPFFGGRVAVIGDSFVFGSGVVEGDVFTSRLSSSDRPFNVWNYGVPGTGPFNALYLWRDYVRQLRPQVVVVTVYAGNDASDALREKSEAKPRSVILARAKILWHRMRSSSHTSQRAPSRVAGAHGWNAFGLDNPATTDALLTAAQKRGVSADSVRARLAQIPDSLVQDALAFRSNPFNVAEAVLDPDGLRHNLLLDTPEMKQGFAAMESALTRLHREVEAAHSQLLLVCIPAAVQVDSTYWWPAKLGVRLDKRVTRDTVFQHELAEFARKEKIELVDLLPAMRKRPSARLYYAEDGHWTGAGHDVAANVIGEKLHDMLPPVNWTE